MSKCVCVFVYVCSYVYLQVWDGAYKKWNETLRVFLVIYWYNGEQSLVIFYYFNWYFMGKFVVNIDI